MDTNTEKQMAKQRRLKLILKRDETYGWKARDECFYNLCDGRGQRIIRFCPDDFHAATGFELEPAEQQKITITIKKRR